jgi:predicted Zn-dependent peptidase
VHTKTVLDNGLRVITSAMPESRSVCLVMLVGAGSCYEKEEEAGISHFAEHLFFKGTHRRPTSRDISMDIEGVGGILNGSTDKELTVLWCKVASPHFTIALDLLSDLLLDSRFDKKDVERERGVIGEEIKMSLDLPQQRVHALMDELLWPEQPLGREVLGYKETVTSITRKQLLDHVAARYVPNNAVLSIAGDMHHEEAMAQIEPLFGKWHAGEFADSYAADDKQTEARLRIEPRDIEQAHLCIAYHGFSYSHPQRFVIDLLSTALGGGMSSRLFTEIRDNKGLAYDIHSYTDHFLDSGLFAVYAGVAPDKLEIAVEAILDEVSDIKERVSLSELTRAKELSKGRLYLRLEDSRSVALWHGGQEIFLNDEILSMDDVTVAIVDCHHSGRP